MIRAIKAVSTERGRDPRDFALVAFGGNGPLFAAGMARALGMTRVVVPPSAGVFSAVGLLASDVEVHLSRSWRRLTRGLDPAALEAAAAALEAEARARLTAQGFPPARIEIRRAATLRYQGQSFELQVRIRRGRRARHRRGALRRRARAHLRPPRRRRGARRVRHPAGDRHRPAGPPAHAGPPVDARASRRPSLRAPPISAARWAGARRR